MREQYERQKEEELIEDCIYNTYMMLTNQMTMDELFERENPWLLYIPDNSNKEKILQARQACLDFFIEREEYEKCQDLMEINI